MDEISDLWADFCIALVLEVDETKYSVQYLIVLRLKHFQRFFFLTLEDEPQSAKEKQSINGFQIRILSFIVDQKQERSNYSLYHGAEQRDCSICRMNTAEEREKFWEIQETYNKNSWTYSNL